MPSGFLHGSWHAFQKPFYPKHKISSEGFEYQLPLPSDRKQRVQQEYAVKLKACRTLISDQVCGKAGTGTTDMIADCRKAGLPEPDFEQRGPYFVVTVWRDWLTDEVMKRIGLRQKFFCIVLLITGLNKLRVLWVDIVGLKNED